MGGAERKLTRRKAELRAREKLGLFKKKKNGKKEILPKKKGRQKQGETGTERQREKAGGAEGGSLPLARLLEAELLVESLHSLKNLVHSSHVEPCSEGPWLLLPGWEEQSEN